MKPWSTQSSRLVYFTLYLVAVVIGAVAYRLLPGEASFQRVLLASAIASGALFLAGLYLKNSGTYDVYWSIVPILYGFLWMGEASAWSSPRALLALFVTVFWGLRLTYNWAHHFQTFDVEDWRYVDLRKKTGGAYPIASLFALYGLPFTLVSLGTLPLYTAIHSTAPLGILDYAGLVTGVVATVLEAVSDVQLSRFRKENRDPAKFLQTGLWAYSRHPNYCGEALYWWASALFGLAVRPSLLMCAGAAGVTAMILFASIPMAEERALAKRPSFADYQRRVSRLIPFFPRSS